jgi:hypothetical protein
VRLENSEYEEQFWLPREQRFEIQSLLHAGERRAIVRGVSRFVQLTLNDSLAHTRAADPESFPFGRMVRGVVSAARQYDAWHHPLGSLTDGLTAYDFEGYAPSVIRPRHGSFLGFTRPVTRRATESD